MYPTHEDADLLLAGSKRRLRSSQAEGGLACTLRGVGLALPLLGHALSDLSLGGREGRDGRGTGRLALTERHLGRAERLLGHGERCSAGGQRSLAEGERPLGRGVVSCDAREVGNDPSRLDRSGRSKLAPLLQSVDRSCQGSELQLAGQGYARLLREGGGLQMRGEARSRRREAHAATADVPLHSLTLKVSTGAP